MNNFIIQFLNETYKEQVASLEKQSDFVVSNFLDTEDYVIGIFYKNSNKLIGFCSCGLADIYDIDEYNSDFLLSDVFVDPCYRNQGVGKQLVNFVQQQAKNNNVAVVLNVLNNNLVSYYQNMGFRLEDSDDGFMIYKAI